MLKFSEDNDRQPEKCSQVKHLPANTSACFTSFRTIFVMLKLESCTFSMRRLKVRLSFSDDD